MGFGIPDPPIGGLHGRDPEPPADSVIGSLVPKGRPRFVGTRRDYELAAREASPMVRHVTVLARDSCPEMDPYHVIVRVRRSWWRLLPVDELRKVQHYIAGLQPVGVRLEVK